MNTLIKVGNIILFIISFGTILFFGVKSMTIEMGIMVTVFLAVGVFLHIDKFTHVKLNKDGFEAQLRDIRNEILITKKVFMNISSIMLTTLSRTGMWGGISDNEKEGLTKSFLISLKECGLEEKEIAEVTNTRDRYVLMDCYIKIYNILYERIRYVSGDDKNEANDIFINHFNIDYNNYLNSRKTSIEAKQFIVKYNLMNDELRNLLDEYEKLEKKLVE